ncbi:MAG TPA: hypothetical protein DCG47_04120 [Spirochaetaceae bacterium]|nr:hypothetical protein [Spirochaetaceae bacterium]
MAFRPAFRPFPPKAPSKRLAICLALGLGLAFPRAWLPQLGAQERGAPEKSPSSDLPALTVGWSELDATQAPPQYGYLASSLPLLLRDATLFAGVRFLSTHEEALLAGRSREGELAAAHKALLEALQKRDAIALQVRDPDRRRQELRLAENALSTARKRYDELSLKGRYDSGISHARESMAPDEGASQEAGTATVASGASAAAVASATPARLLAPWKSTDGRNLLPAQGSLSTTAELAMLCAARGIDYLFYGSVKSAGGFLNLELALYSAALRDTIWRSVEYVAPDALDGLAELFIRPAAGALMGTSYARLFLETEPPNTAIRSEKGTAIVQGQLFFEESLMRLTLSAPGYDTEFVPLLIEPGSDFRLKAALNKRQRARFTIDSDSPGASVYLDGLFLGTVPLELEGFADTKVLRLTAPGKSELQLPLQGSPVSGSLILPALEELGIGYKARLSEAKDQFYDALGWFVVSLPVSVLSFGSFRMYYDAGAAAAPIISDPEAIDSLNTRYIVSQSLFWTSSAVSAGLAVNAVIKLIRYIRAAD